MPAVIVCGQRQGSVAQLGLSGQPGFGQIRHSDDVNAPLAVQTRLSPGRKLWPFNTQVRATIVYCRPRRGGGLLQRPCHDPTHRVSEGHMHRNVLKERRGPTVCVVDKLVWDDQMAGMNLFPHAAHGTHRNDPLHPEGFEAVDIGSKIDRRRWQTMAPTMARQKHHLAPVEGAQDIGIRGWSKRRGHRDFAYVLQSRHGVEATTPDDANLTIAHASPQDHTVSDILSCLASLLPLDGSTSVASAVSPSRTGVWRRHPTIGLWSERERDLGDPAKAEWAGEVALLGYVLNSVPPISWFPV